MENLGTFELPPRLRAAAERAAVARIERELNRPVAVVQLPLWNDSRRAMPNEYARSAIFTVRNKKVPRRTYCDHKIFVVGDCEINFTGCELRAYDDELVWLQVLQLAKVIPLGRWVEFTPYGFCKALGWSTSSLYYAKLHECLLRLKATAVAIHNKRLGRGRAISFVESYEWEDTSGKRLSQSRVRIHPDMLTLFESHQFTELEWEAYLRLSPVARRLYDYTASHRAPHPLRLDTLKRMCASDCVRDRKWKEQVNDALSQLMENNLIGHGEVRLELVCMVRELSSFGGRST